MEGLAYGGIFLKTKFSVFKLSPRVDAYLLIILIILFSSLPLLPIIAIGISNKSLEYYISWTTGGILYPTLYLFQKLNTIEMGFANDKFIQFPTGQVLLWHKSCGTI